VLAGLLVAPACAHAQAVTLRPAIAKPLQAAERDLASRDFAALQAQGGGSWDTSSVIKLFE